jgi:hypothetical protein
VPEPEFDPGLVDLARKARVRLAGLPADFKASGVEKFIAAATLKQTGASIPVTVQPAWPKDAPLTAWMCTFDSADEAMRAERAVDVSWAFFARDNERVEPIRLYRPARDVKGTDDDPGFSDDEAEARIHPSQRTQLKDWFRRRADVAGPSLWPDATEGVGAVLTQFRGLEDVFRRWFGDAVSSLTLGGWGDPPRPSRSVQFARHPDGIEAISFTRKALGDASWEAREVALTQLHLPSLCQVRDPADLTIRCDGGVVFNNAAELNHLGAFWGRRGVTPGASSLGSATPTGTAAWPSAFPL